MTRILERADPQEREELRDYATELVRNASEGKPAGGPPSPRSKRGALLGVGLLMLAAGLGLMVLVPPVGAVIATLALVVLLAGAVSAVGRTASGAIRHFRGKLEASFEERHDRGEL